MKVRYDKGINLVCKFVNTVFPEVDKQLEHWIGHCEKVSNDILRTQALASINSKKFHAQGGSIYALYPYVNVKSAIKFIVSLQTISDYLDNLCDRTGVKDEVSFRQLHLSMLDAISPEGPINDYYLYYPFKNDGSYLKSLVEECRLHLASLPSYHLVADTIKKYVQLYCDLQTYKHLDKSIREDKLISWAWKHSEQHPDVSCWEFSAATGSTLGIFVLFAAASDPNLTEETVKSIDSAYFPWVCGLHILLDYYIDAQEDRQEGDLNFTYYYSNLKCCEDRLTFFMRQAVKACSSLPYPRFHITIIKGLLAMYLSDPKATWGLNRITSRNLLKNGYPGTGVYHNICRFLRLVKKL